MINDKFPSYQPEKLAYDEVNTGMSELSEMPVRVHENGGAYLISFKSIQAAEDFVMAYWAQVDKIRNTPENASAYRRLKSGMWKPNQGLTSRCRTEFMFGNPDVEKVGGVVSVAVNGNTGALQDFGVTALKNLSVIN